MVEPGSSCSLLGASTRESHVAGHGRPVDDDLEQRRAHAHVSALPEQAGAPERPVNATPRAGLVHRGLPRSRAGLCQSGRRALRLPPAAPRRTRRQGRGAGDVRRAAAVAAAGPSGPVRDQLRRSHAGPCGVRPRDRDEHSRRFTFVSRAAGDTDGVTRSSELDARLARARQRVTDQAQSLAAMRRRQAAVRARSSQICANLAARVRASSRPGRG